MTDSRGSERPGRRTNSKRAFSSFRDGRNAARGQESSCAVPVVCSPSTGMRGHACVPDGLTKTPSADTASDAASTSQHGYADPNFLTSMKREEGPNLPVKIGRACLALGTYVALSILTVFWTKHLVGGKVPTPLFLSWVQQAVGLVLYSAGSGAISSMCGRGSVLGKALIVAVPLVRVRARVMLRVLPLSFCFVGMIGSANLCLQRVQVSVYQVARSLTLVFSLLLSVLWLKQRVVVGEVCSCLLVALGFTLMTAVGSDAVSLSGYVMGALASLFQATYTVQMKATLNALQEERENLATLPKRQSSYQLISGASPASCATPGSTGVGTLDSCTDGTDGDADSPQQCSSTNIAGSSKVEASAFADDDWEFGNLVASEQRHQQDQCAWGGAEKTCLPVDAQERRGGECSAGIAGDVELQTRSVALGLEDHSTGVGGDGETNSGASSAPPRSEPVCMFYNMLNAFCLFPIFILISDEPKVLWKLAAEGSVLNATVIAHIIGLGVVTFVLGTSVFWTVSLTSPLSFSVAGYVKTLLQVAVAMAVWGESLSAVEVCGFMLTLGGSLWYSICRCKAN